MIKTIESMETTLVGYKQREAGLLKTENDNKTRVSELEVEKQKLQQTNEYLTKQIARTEEKMKIYGDEVKRQAEETVTKVYEKAKETEQK